MILLTQQYKCSKDETRELEKDLSEAWGEEVRIIPAGYNLVCREESKNDYILIKNKKMQDVKELLKEVDGIEIGSESIILNGDSYKPLSKDEYIDYMIETRRKSLEERWLKICKGCDYIFLGNDECLGEMFYSFHYIKNKAKDSKVTLFEEN